MIDAFTSAYTPAGPPLVHVLVQLTGLRLLEVGQAQVWLAVAVTAEVKGGPRYVAFCTAETTLVVEQEPESEVQ